MKTVMLAGISGKGKNRIREHGDTWILLKEDNEAILVQSQKNSKYVRWVQKTNDDHMVIKGDKE